MPEDRAKKHQKDRMAETLREEISSMIEGELSDPRIRFTYVSEVLLAPGGRSAKILLAVDGGDEAEKETLEALVAARGHIRHELLERLGKRHIPELSFQVDRSKNLQFRIDDLLGRTRNGGKGAGKKTQTAAAPSSPATGTGTASKNKKDA